MKGIGLVACVHGNEKYGIKVLKKIDRISYKGKIIPIIANLEAAKKNKRYIDMDLNRCFPGKQRGNCEQRLAYSLTKILKKCDYVIDLHSSSIKTDPFIITTRLSRRHKELISYIPIKKVVLITKKLAKGNALIDNCSCGISIEIGQHNDTRNGSRAINIIKNMLENLEKRKAAQKTFFSAYAIVRHGEKHPKKLRNFVAYYENKSRVYPILITPRRNAPDGIHYLKARKI